MYLLDSDTVRLALDEHDRVVTRIRRTPNELIYISGITVEEILIHGWYVQIQKSRGSKPDMTLEQAFFQFHQAIKDLSAFNLLPVTKEAESRYRDMPAAVKRVGKADCKLAAHAIVANATVVTRNAQDFECIPGVKFEDWSK